MASKDTDHDLLEEVASQHGVQPELLTALLVLAEEYSAVSGYGTKADFSKRVAEIVDRAARAWSGS